MSAAPKDPDLGYAAHTKSSRGAIEVELSGNIEWDDPSVFAHLGVHDVDADFVNAARMLFAQDTKLQSAKLELIRIAADSSKQETAMYPHLGLIFAFIELLQDKYGNSARVRFSQSSNMRLIIETSDSWDYPSNKPDFSTILAELFESPTNRWRDRRGWCEVKAHASDRPKSDRGTRPKEIVVQTADYARLHMSGRPFQLFSVGLLIYGDEFCVGIYDRAGVRYSPSHNIWKDFDIFIRVVRSITTDMTPEELGEDPTVVTLTDASRDMWFARLDANRLPVEERDEPVYEVSLGGTTDDTDDGLWVTIGTPIWISLSLFGRGTLVWRVRNKATLDLRVMKNAWHSGARTSESEIYQLIEGQHPGVARFDVGADVKFPGTELIISTSSLRSSGRANSAKHAILHRVFIYPIGRSLYRARSELELVKGMRAALRGHEFLCNQYILHRDISVGNIMLSSEDDPPEGAEGFLMDLELARCSGPRVEYTVIAPVRTPTGQILNDVQVRHSRWDTHLTKRGAPMTGTLQFMAVVLLESLEERVWNEQNAVGPPMEHKVHHDIESFIWVLIYSLMRRIIVVEASKVNDADKHLVGQLTTLKTRFIRYFGRSTPSGILGQRGGAKPWNFVQYHPEFFSEPIRDLIDNLDRQFRVRKEEPFTHAAVLGALDAAIRRLS
ncbi:hypothetical protein CERSUDRAFT_117899 [Gelatoporia subvermispora B]|uniref:Fungal-type protein kinase domain-containing protein n=1 Tax=Ceriporiopsis subvermispora (strain B) TaxID=914234 RepID=M2QA83_CERS8|nr:hypothetical protein CERSUDRAFT_117899 [Gelatoporia subvermispora B]